MAGDNTVQITLKGKDDTGAAYTSAEAKSKAFQSLMDQTTKKEIAGHQAVANAETQHLKTTKLLADADDVLSGKMDNLGKSGESAAEKLGTLGGAGNGIGVGAIGALVAGGVALAPVIASVAFGLGGLGLAAAGAIAPVLKAAQATGGLRANMASLNPEQQAVARSLLSLQGTYDKFEKSLAPTVLKDFNAGIAAVKPLLAGVEPVAKSAGKALQSVFADLGGTFNSSQWKQFFQFMAAEAGPDIRMLGADFANFAKGLPGVVESLKPVSDSLMGILGEATQLTSILGSTSQAIDKAGHSAGGGTNWFGKLADGLKQLGPALLTGGVSVAAQHFKDMGQSADDAAPKVGHLASATNSAASAAREEASAVSAATSALTKGLAPLENYIGATLTQKNDEAALKTALKASGDEIGLKTQKQRDSFSAAQTYLKDTLTQAQAALTAHKSTQTEISGLQTAIGVLESVGGKTAAYRGELALLKAMLDKIRLEKDITKYVTVVTRDVKPGGFQEFHAAGGIIGAAGGGPRGGMTWVGEQGPELVRLPLGSTVFPAGQSKALAAQSGGGGGNSYSINVTVAPGGHPGETGRQIVQLIREFEKRSGTSWRAA